MGKLGILGWGIATVLFVILLLERGCISKAPKGDVSKLPGAKTVTIPGDAKPIVIQDTILMPGKVKWKKEIQPVDSGAIITEYMDLLKAYTDTVKGDDAIITIRDSMPTDSTIKRKVTIKNTRVKQEVTIAPEKYKLFIGFNMGINIGLNRAFAGPSVILLTKNDQLYQVGYDVLNNAPSIGMSWKLHFGK